MNEFKTLADLLQILLHERGLGAKLEASQVPEQFRTIVGEAISRKLESVVFTNGELIIRTTSPIWRIELRLRAESFRQKINSQLGREVVRSISVY